jgi:DNA-binding MarR family transcriptional regulator
MDDAFDAFVDDALYASRAFVALAVRTMAQTPGLTMPQHRALLEVALRGPQSLTSLSSLLGTPPSGTSRLCDRLIAKGLMSKRTSPKSGRAIELNITSRGAALISTVLNARRDELAEALAKIPEDERARLRDSLTVIALTLEEPREFLAVAE